MNNENLELFDRMVIALEANYAPLEVYHLKDKGDIKLGDPAAKRTCRFCGRTEPEVTFKKVAHAIPHFIGNRTLKSLYECDECNEKVFSPMESQFSQFMSFYHTFYHVSRGGKVPTFKNNDKEYSKIVVEGSRDSNFAL